MYKLYLLYYLIAHHLI